MAADERDVALLAELLCARLCHDLAGTIGAVTAGAELLAEESTASPMAAEAVDLMASSAASMAAKLRFLRLALGPANAGAAGQARQLAEAYFSKGFPQGGWVLDWPVTEALPEQPDRVKLLLNLICLAQECLPRGGTILVRPLAIIPVSAQGDGAVLGEAAQGLTALAFQGVSPRAAQGAYTALLARHCGTVVTPQPSDGALMFRLHPVGPR